LNRYTSMSLLWKNKDFIHEIKNVETLIKNFNKLNPDIVCRSRNWHSFYNRPITNISGLSPISTVRTLKANCVCIMTILDQMAVQILREFAISSFFPWDFGICYFFSREVGIRTPPNKLLYYNCKFHQGRGRLPYRCTWSSSRFLVLITV
jgi:hypothetical protein